MKCLIIGERQVNEYYVCELIERAVEGLIKKGCFDFALYGTTNFNISACHVIEKVKKSFTFINAYFYLPKENLHLLHHYLFEKTYFSFNYDIDNLLKECDFILNCFSNDETTDATFNYLKQKNFFNKRVVSLYD